MVGETNVARSRSRFLPHTSYLATLNARIYASITRRFLSVALALRTAPAHLGRPLCNSNQRRQVIVVRLVAHSIAAAV